MIIDSHQHFWQLARGDYSWLTPSLTKLYRDFLPHNLEPVLKKLNIKGTILVQAAPTMAETLFLLKLAEEHAFILGVVGWIDFDDKNAILQMTTLKQNPYFLGLRPMLQDIADPNWILQDKFIPCFENLENLNLTFDALILPTHLQNLIKIVERHPNLKIVIDHGAKPYIKNKMMDPWKEEIKIISTFQNVYCKFSGLITEANTWSDLLPFMDHIFECFGVEKMMWGSDYPVLNLVSDYQEWYQFAYDYVKRFGCEAINAVFGGVAKKFYNAG